MPESLSFHEDIPDWEGYGEKLLEELYQMQSKLGKPAILPPRARFRPGPAVHVQFDGGCSDGEATGGFVILDTEGKEVIRAGKYFGNGQTNNEAEALALREAMNCLVQLKRSGISHLNAPVRVFGDSQLLIKFLTGLYHKPGKPIIY